MIEYLLDKISEWESLGVKTDHEGSKIIAHIPRDFPEAYLHGIYAPRGSNEWESYGVDLPDQLQKLYGDCNGLTLFLGCISIYGIRAHYKRDLSAQFQPFDLKTHNDEHRQIWHPATNANEDVRIFFGSYSDGSGIYLNGDHLRVECVLRDSVIPYCDWPDLETFFMSEYDRLNSLHDRNGYLIDTEEPIIPI